MRASGSSSSSSSGITLCTMLSSWTGLLLLLLASTAAVAAASSEALDPRLAKYHTLAAKNDGVLPLTSASYDELVSLNGPAGAGPGRNYSISVILTALNPKFGCAPCQAFDKEHREVAKQWWAKSRKAGGQAAQMKHIFGVLDFEKGQEIFKRVGCTPGGRRRMGQAGPVAVLCASRLAQRSCCGTTEEHKTDDCHYV